MTSSSQSYQYTGKEKLIHLVAGSIAGVANVIVGHPLDTLKIRMQSLNLSLISSAKLIYTNEGYASFYKGVVSQMATVPFAKSLNFFAYEFGIKMLGVTNSPSLPAYYTFLAGFWSGLPVSFIVSPSELIKCRLQLEGIGGRVDKSKGFQMMKDISEELI